MGKGDKRSAKGKRVKGSSGVSRQRKKVKYVATIVEEKKETTAPAKKAAPKKAAVKKPAAKKPAAKKPAVKKTATKKAE